MSDGRLNNRVWQLEQVVKQIQKDIDHLKEAISAPRDKHNARISPESAPEQKDNATQRQLALKTKIPPTPSNSHQTNKTWYKTLNGWKRAIEMIAIPFAIGYAVVTYFQWHDARHNFQVDERAWIRARSSKDINGVIVNGAVVPWNSGTIIVWPIVLTNIGKSVTTDIRSDVRLEMLDSRQPPSLDFSQPHSKVEETVLFPRDEDTLNVPLGTIASPQSLTKDQYDSLMNGSAYLAVYIQTTYRDQFGEHWTRSCSWQGGFGRPGDPPRVEIFTSEACVNWNAVGDGHPPDGAVLR